MRGGSIAPAAEAVQSVWLVDQYCDQQHLHSAERAATCEDVIAVNE